MAAMSMVANPIAGVLIAADPIVALAIRKAALARGILFTCVADPDRSPDHAVAIESGRGAESRRALALAKGERRVTEAAETTVSGGGFDIAVVVCAQRAQSMVRSAISAYQDTPVVAVVGEDVGPEQRAALIRAGAADVLAQPYSVEEMATRLLNVAQSHSYKRFSTRTVTDYEEEVRNTIGEILLREYEALYVLGKASEYKDQETGAHIARVAHYSRLIARMIGLAQSDQETLFHASALHDVGKIGIPDRILLKPGRLDSDEVTVMKTHTTNGHGMLKDAASSFLLTGAMIALTHHERFDGGGYPMGIIGEEIPLFGRIVCVADVFDALTTRRPYKDAWSIEEALGHLRGEREKQFDPILVDAFVYNEPRVRQIFHDHSDHVYRAP